MVVEQGNFIQEKVGNKKISRWIIGKLDRLCTKEGIEIPEESRWELGFIEEIEENEKLSVKRLLCQREFNDQAVGFILTMINGQASTITVFLDLPDKFISLKKEKYYKDYYKEIVFNDILHGLKSVVSSSKGG